MKKPTLAACIAQSLNAKLACLPGTNQQAVWLNNHWVSLPHLSYGQWPPHQYVNIPPPQILQSEHWQWRGSTQKQAYGCKTASWLYLHETPLVSNQLKRKIKKARATEFSIEQGGLHLLTDFWNIYAHQLHRLGSFPLPKRFFHALLLGFEEGFAEIFLLRHEGKVVGGACNLFVAGFYENAWFATEPLAQKQYASYQLHEEMIGRAIELKADVYSFGRSTTNSGVHRFKQQWGTKDVSLHWVKNGKPLQGRYALKPLGKLLQVLPFRWVVFLGEKAFKFIY